MSSLSGHEAGAASARRNGASTPLVSRPGERQGPADAAPDPGIALGGVRLWRRCATTAERPGGCVDTTHGMRLLLVDPDSEAGPCAAPLLNAWTIGLSAQWTARWFGLTPAASARRFAAEDEWVAPLSAYLRGWAWEELEALRSSFEKELVGEHLMGLLAMAMAAAAERPTGGPDAR